MDDEDQFDSLLGGTEQLPGSLTLAKFVACRSQEIQVMKNSLLVQSGCKLAFQTLPRHMRRRAMAHNVKRLPRRLRQMHFNQMKKSGMPKKQKRPSRKYRRHPRNLVLEYTKRSSKKYKWLQTHIWHAKRFHMIEKWGYKLPHYPCDKAFRACYRAMSEHCLLQDISYIKCVEITGDKDLIIDHFKRLTRSEHDLTIGAKAFIKGSREGELTLFEIDAPQKAIGTINFLWEWNDQSEPSKLWLWIHAAFYDTANKALMDCFRDSSGISVEQLDLDLSRFRLTGPLSNAVLHDSLKTLTMKFINKFSCPNSEEILRKQCEFWHKITNASTTDVPPHLVVSLIVNDPRLYIPKKRTKSLQVSSECLVYDVPNGLANSPLWNSVYRKEANNNREPDSEIAKLQAEMLVPGSDIGETGTLVPVILIQRPGNKKHNAGFGSGWDVVIPKNWAKTFWIAFVMRGARVGGLRESNSMLFEMGKPQCLQPDTIAGMEEELKISEAHKNTFFKKPPNKRVNYNKFKTASPFSCNWKLLIKEWGADSQNGDFTVLRDKRILDSIEVFLTSKNPAVPKCPKNVLIPVTLECEKKGCPTQYSIICIPKFKSDLNRIVEEPTCNDTFQSKRKILRDAHQSFLKKLRKQRKTKTESFDVGEYNEIMRSYTEKIRGLWLPEPTTIRNSCSREVIGFITKGGFSFSRGKSCATGYITGDCLSALKQFRSKVLFRNTNSKLYKLAKLTVILE